MVAMDVFKNDMRAWRSRRRNTTVLSMAIVTYNGIENVAIVISLMYYLKDTLRIENPAFWYGVVLSAIVVSEAISSIVVGRYMDKTRNGRLTVLLTLIVAVIGNIMYTLDYSVWFLIVGRFLSGLLQSQQVVVAGIYFNPI